MRCSGSGELSSVPVLSHIQVHRKQPQFKQSFDFKTDIFLELFHQVLFRVPMQLARSLRPGSSPSCTIHRTSHSSASVAVAWEKLKGHNDAGEAVKSGQWSDQSVSKSAVPAAPVAENSASASASSLVSPLPSVVAAQTEFIKQTLRATYAHVSTLKPLFFMPYPPSHCNNISDIKVLWLPKDSDGVWLKRDNGM